MPNRNFCLQGPQLPDLRLVLSLKDESEHGDRSCEGVNLVLCRAQLQKEKQLRESAEKERKEMEERLKKYETEVESSRKGELLNHAVSFFLKFMLGWVICLKVV